MAGTEPNPARRRLEGIGGVARLAVLIVGVVLIAVIGLRGPDAEPAPTSSLPPVAGVGAASSPADTAQTATVESSDPVPTPMSAPTAEATAEASDEPTTAPTAKPTPSPKPVAKPTPRPTHDPTPEGTPRITTKSGSFGQTLTVAGIAVRVAKTDPLTSAIRCTTDDPERQGWTEVISYDITMTWPDAGDAQEPWVAVGAKPWNVLQFDGPSPFKSGADYIVTTCHRPSDSDKVMVEISPPGSPIIYYRWYFH